MFPSPNIGTSLIRIHKVITRGLAVSIENCQGTGPEPEQREGFRRYVQALTSSLIAHHDGEEEISFPFLQTKMPDGPFPLLKSQHGQMLVMLDRIRAWQQAGGAAWEPASLAGLQAGLADLSALWHVHIPIEEANFGPKEAAKLLTPEENGRLEGELSGHAAKNAQPAELVLPFVLFNLSGADRLAMEQSLPPVISQQLVPAWKPAWAPMQPFFLD